MRIRKFGQQGFGTIEILIVVGIIVVAALAGLYVYHHNHKSQPASQTSVRTGSSASKIANTLSNQKTGGSTSSSSASNVIQTPIQSTPGTGTGNSSNITFTSKYTGLQFTYPSTWSSKTWSNDSSSGAITITSADGNVLLSYGSPVVTPTNSCSASSTKIHIYDVESGPTLSNTKALYIISFNNGTRNSVALTDWDGQTPTVGDTDKCSSYQPSYVNTSTGAYSWFDISDLSDSYRALDYSTFAAQTDVKDAISIIQTAKQ